jgi:uncharacterized protein YndB with AHSA1/START domain
MRPGSVAAGAVLAATAGYRLLVSGALTLDTGWGRSVRALGPFEVEIAAPPETVFDVVAAPYLGRVPRALADKIEVLERGSDMVLAAHRTRVRAGLVATTVETVRFERPSRVGFRLVRGPVPHVVEQFLLDPADGGTRLRYVGELGTDLWAVGRWWGERVARHWEAVVRASFDSVLAEAERRAAAGGRNTADGGSPRQ